MTKANTRRRAIAMFVLPLMFVVPLISSCGFKPMHAPNSFGGTGLNFSDIAVKTTKEDKPDFLLKQALRDRIGKNDNARYVLTIKPKISRGGLGIGGDDVASRYDMTMSASFLLMDSKSGTIVFSDSVSATSTFAAASDAYGTIAAQNNANVQVATETADRILIRLGRYKNGQNLSGKKE